MVNQCANSCLFERDLQRCSCFRCIVWTSDNQAFFFNPTSRSSRWDRPEELKGTLIPGSFLILDRVTLLSGRIEVDEMIRAFIAEREPNTASQTQTTKQKLDPTITDGEPDAKKLK